MCQIGAPQATIHICQITGGIINCMFALSANSNGSVGVRHSQNSDYQSGSCHYICWTGVPGHHVVCCAGYLETCKFKHGPNLAEAKQANWYATASKQIVRLIRVTPGRIDAIYGEAVAGATVIRVFGAQGVHLQGRLCYTCSRQLSSLQN